MSQVKFNTIAKVNGKQVGVQVVGGWDIPLNYYHLSIFYDDDGNEDRDFEVIFSSLDKASWFIEHKDQASVGGFKHILDFYSIKPPDEFYSLCKRKEGNVIWIWQNENCTWHRI